MFEVQVLGVQNFMGMEIPVVEGGFGESKRCLTDKTISEIHNQPTREIRKSINRNIKRFKKNIDFIDLKDGNKITNNLLVSLGYSKMEISKATNIYLLSERGYAKLIKIMDTDLAWEIHDKLIDEYFTMRQQIKQQVVSVEQVTQMINEAVTKQVMVMMNPIIDRLDKIVQGVNAPRSEQLTFDTSDLPYTATNIGKKINRTASVTNKILLQRGILSVKDGSWTLNKQYEDKGWGKTVKGQYRGKTYVRYTEKGMQEIIKILSRSSNQEQIKLF